MVKTQGSAKPHVVTGEDRRRSRRVMIRNAVTLRLPNKISVEAFTISVNDNGATILSPRPILAETMLELQNTATKEVQACRVVRRPIESTGGYLVPVEFTGTAANFWGISFPAPNWKAPEN
jgi:hypothetical protein